MATIAASGQYAGRILGDDGTPAVSNTNPYSTYVANMGNLLAYITKRSAAGNAAMTANNEGITRGETALATPGDNNPVNPILNMMPGSARTGVESTLGSIMEPAKLSNAGQAANAEQNSANLTSEVNAQINAYDTMKPAWTLSPQPNAEGQWYYYNTNVPPGSAPQQYPAGEIPPGVGGSPGGSPGSSADPSHLSASHNPYGIKMTSTTTDMFGGLGATPGPAATDGGNFWSFPDDSTGEKAARTLLTSSLYANDSVDQALRQWSNYTGTGAFPGYNGDILKGTGIDPNATIKSLSSMQIDTVLAAMKKAESVGGNAPQTPPGSLMDNAVSQVISGAIGFDDQFNSLNNMYGGKLTKAQFLAAVQKQKPDFNVNQSNSVAAGQGTNTETAAVTGALIDKTNQVLDLLPAKFDQLMGLQKEGGDIAGNIGDALVNSSGLGKTASDDYYRTLADARASAQQVLTTAASLGVVTGGQTADSLLPQHMSKDGLAEAIATIKDLEEKTKQALAKLSNAGGATPVPTTNNNPLGI